MQMPMSGGESCWPRPDNVDLSVLKFGRSDRNGQQDSDITVCLNLIFLLTEEPDRPDTRDSASYHLQLRLDVQLDYSRGWSLTTGILI